MRAQFIALNADAQTRATTAEVNSAISSAVAGTSSNSNNVATLNQSADYNYNQTQMQDVLNKLDELINTLRR